MSATLESKAVDLAADIGKLGATALRIKEERDVLAEALRELTRAVDHIDWDCTKSAAHGRLDDARSIAYAALAQVQS
jgi:hypothetical protein